MTIRIVDCQYCGKDHGRRCPEVRAIEYYEDRSVKRVEFMTARDYMTLSGTGMWPDPLTPVPWKPPMNPMNPIATTAGLIPNQNAGNQ